MSKVLEPFFTTKEVGKGTGLGLSMVYGFIKQSRGHIKIFSEVGIGTAIRLYFPQSGRAAEQARRIKEALPLAHGTERILVVEDEPQVRASVVQQLQSIGYTVVEAPDAQAGIKKLEAAESPFDLMLTDVVMPGPLNGKTLADEVAGRWPGIKIVFMSGFTELSAKHHGRIAAHAPLLCKPFRKAELALVIRKALSPHAGLHRTPKVA